MTTHLSPDLILREIERINASRAFQRASRQKSLLSYLVIEALEGRSDHLKEYSIGIAVFGKEPTFDPRLDSIVRVEAHKLRARLARYFDTEGKSDPVRVELPVGATYQFSGRAGRSPGRRLRLIAHHHESTVLSESPCFHSRIAARARATSSLRTV